MLCQICHQFLEIGLHEVLESRERRSSRRLVASMLQTAIDGCQFCFLVCHDSNGKKSFGRLADTVDLEVRILARGKSLVLIRVYWGSVYLRQYKRLYILPCSHFCPELELQLLDESTESVRSWARAESWIKECVSIHVKCNGGSDCSYFPVRLLDVGFHDAINLCVGPFPQAGMKYVTLSHRWGGAEILRLTNATLVSFQQGIPLSDLPKTFQDAVIITRRLGVRYLWIDSLCITQDDLQDWESQAAQMGEIYQNAFLNIAATASEDSTGGCFRQRNPRCAMFCPIQTSCNIGRSAGSEQTVGNYYCVDAHAWETGIDDAPLNCRAWVLQERFLSRRVLHFGASQLLWECRETRHAEHYPETIQLELAGSFITSRYFVDSSALNVSSGAATSVPSPSDNIYGTEAMSHDELYSFWGKLVELYSKCSLTKESDKLIAFSGITKSMLPLFKDEYLAGLWRKNLMRQLLWYSADCDRPEKYTAPSWSWASLRVKSGDIDNIYEFGSIEEIARIVDVKVTPSNEDSMSAVTGGVLRLQGQLFRVQNPNFHEHTCSFTAFPSLILDYYYGINDDISNGAKAPPLDLLWMPLYISPLAAMGLVLKRIGDTFQRFGTGAVDFKNKAKFKQFLMSVDDGVPPLVIESKFVTMDIECEKIDGLSARGEDMISGFHFRWTAQHHTIDIV